MVDENHPLNKRKLTAAEMKQRWDAGDSMSVIGEAAGVTRARVQQVLNKAYPHLSFARKPPVRKPLRELEVRTCKNPACGRDFSVPHYVGSTYCRKRCYYQHQRATSVRHKIDVDKATQEWLAGMTCKDLAEKYGVSIMMISLYVVQPYHKAINKVTPRGLARRQFSERRNRDAQRGGVEETPSAELPDEVP